MIKKLTAIEDHPKSNDMRRHCIRACHFITGGEGVTNTSVATRTGLQKYTTQYSLFLDTPSTILQEKTDDFCRQSWHWRSSVNNTIND
jgi:hypothetical protein